MKLIAVSLSIQHTNSNIPIAANVDIGTIVFSDIGARYVVALPAMRKMQEMYKRIIENSK